MSGRSVRTRGPSPAFPPAFPSTLLAAVAAVVLGGSTAAAQDDPRPSARLGDANSDRVLLLSTAETHPQGTFFLSDYELLFLQAGYAPTDRIQTALTVLPPILQDQPYFFDLSLKWNVIRTPGFRGSLLGAFDVLLNAGVGSTFYGGRLGAVGQVCFDPGPCRSSVSLNATAMLTNHLDSYLPVLLGAGLTVGLSRVVSILLEPAYVFESTGNHPADSVLLGARGFLLDYGLRLSGRSFAVDVAFLRPFGITNFPFIFGVPWVGITYRFGPNLRSPLVPAAPPPP